MKHLPRTSPQIARSLPLIALIATWGCVVDPVPTPGEFDDNKAASMDAGSTAVDITNGGAGGLEDDAQTTSYGDGQSLEDGESGDATAGDVESGDATAAVPWTHFRYDKTVGPCPPKVDCTWRWDLDPQGEITSSKQGVESKSKLSAADLSAIRSILDSPAFLDKMTQGFSCGGPPTDIFISFTLSLSGVQHKQPVTGCTFSDAGDGPLVQKIKALITAH